MPAWPAAPPGTDGLHWRMLQRLILSVRFQRDSRLMFIALERSSGAENLEHRLQLMSPKRMPSIKITGIAAALLVAAGVVALVRHGRAQPADTSTYAPENMKDYKKPESRSCERSCLPSKLRSPNSAARNRRSTTHIGTNQ